MTKQINEVNLGKWLKELRTTDIPQVTGTLVRLWDYAQPPKDSNVTGMCCLGVGEYLMTGEVQPMLGRTLPKLSFAQWLGARSDVDSTDDPLEHGVSLYIEWPGDLLPRGEYYETDDPDATRYSQYVEVAELNDDYKLTFSQIADVIEYMGLMDE